MRLARESACQPAAAAYREAHLAMEMMSDRAQIVAIDLVEANPVLDTRSMTGILAAELAQGLLGKRIL